jgi:recombinational DNA repair ATPase RecF
MDDAPYFLKSLTLAGFRAYLDSQTFPFAPKRCLAVFGANGTGKSGLIDALEFLFSPEGTLARLGVKAINNQAGITALAHNLANDRKIEPQVVVAFTRGNQTLEGARKATGSTRICPTAATTISGCFKVDPIIRGYSLRRFVEEQKAEERYSEVARWLQLTPLVDVQKNLRLLRQQVKAASEDNSTLLQIDNQISRETSNAVVKWDEAAVLAYANTIVLAPLDTTLKLTKLDVDDPAFENLKQRAKAEEQNLGLAGLKQIKNAAAAIYAETKDPETKKMVTGGLLPLFESAVITLAEATTTEAAERGKAAAAVFANLWEAAKPLFAEGGPEIESCPICDTPIKETKTGSRVGIAAHIAKHLGELKEYAAAKAALDLAISAANASHTRLVAGLKSLLPLLTAGHAALKNTVESYIAAIEGWKSGAAVPNSVGLRSALVKEQVQLAAAIAEIDQRQGDHTYVKALAKIERFIELKKQYDLACQLLIELVALSTSLNTQAAFVSGQIRKKVQTLLDVLRVPANDIYKSIQGPAAAPVRLELPPEDDTNQQRLNLLVDFATNRQGVQPGGYLSDSQIHSLALALRLAAIKMFNGGAPIVALDDIVTSYDADHRRKIAAMIGTELADFQVLLTTHDQRFFNYLKDQLLENQWRFQRITKLDPKFGPRFAEHMVTDAMIQARWDRGDSAANEMRQAEEEWLTRMCRDFGADIRIRDVDRAHSYERGELALALAISLKRAGLQPPLVPGVKNRFLTSLQKGEIENFGSHFQEGPYGDGSVGDEKARWGEFTYFRNQIACPKCNRQRFKRPTGLNKPVCADDKCETPFQFKGNSAG